MASRTRQRLIEVARQLFAHKGLENTTMNDIATASDRGRRTIYTYFRTKSDIYQAVIEDESARILRELEAQVGAYTEPTDKLRALMEFRISVVTDNQQGGELWLRSLFNRDTKRAGKIRAMVTTRILEMIDSIVTDGVERGLFIREQAERLPSVLAFLVRGTDFAAMRDDDTAADFKHRRRECVDFIVRAVTKS